jgi:CBS domain containing-hemolysin-like protein
VDSDSLAGVALLALAVIVFIFVVAAEAGVIAGVRSRALGEPPTSRMEALRRFTRERQATLSALALARNLTLVGITAITVALVLEDTGHGWGYVAIAALTTLFALMLLQSLPRLLVSQNPERWRKILGPFVEAVRLVFGAPARLLDLPVAAVLNWWRRRHPEAALEAEELVRLVEMEEAGSGIAEEERQMIRGIMEMEQTTVREVMVPRIDIVAVDAEDGFAEAVRLMAERGYSRLPVYQDTIDNVVGVVYAKEVLRHLARGTTPVTLTELARTAYFVPESKKVDELLAEMRQKRLSIAVVVDEYGGTAGIVTVEDLIEEIVGEIEDEFDPREQPVQLVTPTEAIVDARVGIDDLNEMLDLRIEKEDFDSVGGFIFNSLGRMPSVGDEVRVDGLVMRVLSVIGRRIKKVRIIKLEGSDLEAQEERQAG